VNRRIVAIVVALSIVCGVAALVAAASRHARPAAATRYVCPMHASVVSDRPGTCPLCNMALVLETPSEAAAPTASVMLGDAQRTRANVATVPAAVRDLVSEAVVPGQVVWDERRLTRVAARVAGRIERVYGGPTGTRIEAGQPLFDVDSPDLVVAQKEFLLALDGAHDTMMDGLREAVDEGLGGLREVPLEVSGEPGAVVEDAEQVGGDPRPLGRQHLAAPLVIVGVPQPVHGRELEGADLDRRALLLGA